MSLRHKKCGGTVLMDVSKSVKMLTPSYSFGFDGISVGIVEFVLRDHPENDKVFECSKCRQEFDKTSDELECQCLVCRKYVTPSKVIITREIPFICEECFAGLTAKSSQGLSPKIVEFRSMMTLSAGTPKRLLSEILKQPISI